MQTRTKVQAIALAVVAMVAVGFISEEYFSDITPHARLSTDRLIADVDEIIIFNIIDATANTNRFLVDFHDGSEPLDLRGEYTFSHAFSCEGLYNITLISVSTAGLTESSNLAIRIENLPPLVAIECPLSAPECESVMFSVPGEMAQDSPADLASLEFRWEFGDGTNASGRTTEHTYAQSGRYPVSVFAFDDQGAIGYSTTEIAIMNYAPSAVFSANVSTVVIL